MQVNVDIKKYLEQSEQLTHDIIVPEIKNQNDFDNAGLTLTTVRKNLKTVNDWVKGIRKEFNDLRDKSVFPFSGIVHKLTDYESKLKNEIQRYFNLQEKLRLEQEEKLRKQQEAEAERLRKRAENAKKEETKERLEDQANELETIVPITTQTKNEGVSFTTNWKWRFKNPNIENEPKKMRELMKTILETEPTLLKLDIVAMNKYASDKKGTKDIEGIVFYSEKIPVSRRS